MNILVFAVDRNDVADYVDALFLVYLILLFGRILLSWIPRLPYNPVVRSVVDFIHQVTDPYLNLFRRILPPVWPCDPWANCPSGREDGEGPL